MLGQHAAMLKPPCQAHVTRRIAVRSYGQNHDELRQSSKGLQAERGFDLFARDDRWFQSVPQVRVRQADDRARQQLGELAVLNESLKGGDSWKIRQRVEYLKRKRKAWEGVYNAACKDEVSLTLADLEKAISEVDHALRGGAEEYQSISDTREELLRLRSEVEGAYERLRVTQERVDENVKKLDELKAEAAVFARLQSQLASVADIANSNHPEVTEALGTSLQKYAESAAPGTDLMPEVGGSSVPKAKPTLSSPAERAQERLRSSLTLEKGLRNFWYAVEFSSRLETDLMKPVDLFGQPWVLFRDEKGKASCVQDECAHRACPLSEGSVVDGKVQCPYHGWTFNSSGDCVKMPSTVQCKGIKVSALPTVERDGFIWVWPGDAEPVEVPSNTLPPGNFTLHSEIEVEIPVEHGLLMENLLDLAHAPFTHTSTFARGWPIPDAVRFHTQKMLGGNWDPYPIDMSFEPPCMVVSMIGLKKPGQIEAGSRASECKNHLHQLHVCLPSKPGHTRLLYRMSLDFMGWLKVVPGIKYFWEYIAGQVLGEDLVLVKGQQDRMLRGGNTWRTPVSYDKLAVRYRAWRNDLDKHAKLPKAVYKTQTMAARDLFSLDEDTGDYGNNK